MTDDNVDLLAVIGRVIPPTPAALEAAREVLWSAVATEMLSGTERGATPWLKALRANPTRHRRAHGSEPDS